MSQSEPRIRARSRAGAVLGILLLAGVLAGIAPRPAAAATPPVAVDDSFSTPFGETLNQGGTGVLANDTDDGPPASLTATVATNPTYGAVSINANGSFIYIPLANFVGTDTFTYTVSDGVDGSDTGLVTITVTPNAAQILKDVNPTGTSNPSRSVQVGSSVYFYSFDPATQGLWITDGTTAGTTQLKNLNMVALILPLNQPPIPVGGKVVFQADDGVNGSELWVSDGTPAGTVLLKDINSGPSGSFPTNLVLAGGNVFFQATDATNGAELWKTDGTAAGTVLVKDIRTGSTSSSPNCGNTTCNGMFAFGSSILFAANDGTNGTELWKSDGTDPGTQMVKNINPGGNASPQRFTALGSTVLFSATDGSTGAELFRTDGTDPGTVLVANINPGSAGSSPACGAAACLSFNVVGSNAYFGATTAASGIELWKSDGTTAGTALVKEINPGTASSVTTSSFATVLGTLLFTANDGTSGIELWKSDGTAPGTVMVKDINPGSGSASPNVPGQIGSVAYFGANDGTHGNLEMFKTDGTAAGTVLAKDINPGSTTSAAANFVPALGTMFFTADNGTNGREPWRLAPPNNAPVANNDAHSTNEDTPLTVNAPGVVGNDTDADSNVFHDAIKFTDPANGSVTFGGDGSFTYTPNANYNGPDSFTYKSYDGMDYSNAATVNITVNAVADAPVAGDDSYATAKDAPLTVVAPGVLGNDSDPDADPLSAGSASDPPNGSVALNGDGSFTYTPDAGYVGSDSFTYTLTAGADTDTATVTIAVTVPTVVASPASVTAGNAVTATWSGIAAPTATDWVGLYDSSSALDPALLAWSYTNGSAAGNLNLTVPLGSAPGATYELRLFSANTYTRLATSAPFTVTASATTLSASPASVPAGGLVAATWAGIAAPTATDWVGLYDSASAPNAALLSWAYTGGSAGGNLNLAVPGSATPGAAYELRLFTANTYVRIATSAPFAVTAANTTLAATPASVVAGTPVTATWSAIPAPSAADWVGLYASSAAPDTALVAWSYTNGSGAGNMNLTVPISATSGAAYELRLFSNNTYVRLATSNAFSVVASNATISSSLSTVVAGNPLTATWSAIGAPSPTDWVGIYDSSGAADPAIVAWAYTGGAAAGSINIVVPAGATPGATYELRLYSNNTYTRLATSAPFTVT